MVNVVLAPPAFPPPPMLPPPPLPPLPPSFSTGGSDAGNGAVDTGNGEIVLGGDSANHGVVDMDWDKEQEQEQPPPPPPPPLPVQSSIPDAPLPPISPWDIELSKAAGTWEGPGAIRDEKERCRHWCQLAKPCLVPPKDRRQSDEGNVRNLVVQSKFCRDIEGLLMWSTNLFT